MPPEMVYDDGENPFIDDARSEISSDYGIAMEDDITSLIATLPPEDEDNPPVSSGSRQEVPSTPTPISIGKRRALDFDDSPRPLKLNRASALKPDLQDDEPGMKNLSPHDMEIMAKIYEKEHKARSPWKELDAEAVALKNDKPYALMGFDRDGTRNSWHGGKVIFRASLHEYQGHCRLKLDRPELGPSTNVTRRFGSHSILRVKLPKTPSSNALAFVRRPLLVCGGVYRAFYAKESTVFYFRTNEALCRSGIHPSKTMPGLSFLDFMRWANPPETNGHQGMCKWASRFALILSSTEPGYLLERENVCFEDDIIHPDTKSNMTDGAGSIGRHIMSQLVRYFDWDERPSAIQVRVFGSKGVLVDDKVDREDMKKIYLTPSQRKVIYPESDMDPAHLVIDIVRNSRIKTSKKLAVEVIINLAENGVPPRVFTDLLHDMLLEQVDAALTWNGPDAMIRLAAFVEKIGGLRSARLARENPGRARVNGYSEADVDDNEMFEDDDNMSESSVLTHQSTAWWPDPVSGSPSSLEETVLALLQSGFHPGFCPVLAEKLKAVIRTRVSRLTHSYRIEVPMSCMAMIVPDKRGILKEGEIFFRSSHRDLLDRDGEKTDIITGDVLITRYPCKLPTDIQKASCKAVDHPGLHDLVGVIILSTKGTRRAADFIGGGDYDGDKAMIIWHPPMVEAFTPKNQCFADPPEPGFKEKYFDSGHNVPVAEFYRCIQPLSTAEQIYKIQDYSLAALQDTASVGRYSNFHENAIQMLGYDHPETIRLAHMFCMVLDGSKTGLRVKKSVEEADRARFNYEARPWKAHMTENDRKSQNKLKDYNPVPLPIRPTAFIMDHLLDQAVQAKRNFTVKINGFFSSNTQKGACRSGCGTQCIRDQDLCRPYEEIVAKSEKQYGEGYKADLEKIRSHVERIFVKHGEIMKASLPKKATIPSTPSAGASFTGLPIETRQNHLRALAREYAQSPDPSEMHMSSDSVRLVKASYAYIYDHQKDMDEGWSRFPWNIAFRDLCLIKALTHGNFVPITDDFQNTMVIKLPKHPV
ncbi:hypothetical protein CC1G_00360 [Coprinopsis cinerea okayama7|uniref:RNA-dependent RNA polymerase n=1 Tax=Coprinopsis cinerea (strain Okayama-7 / 130 / ATCC MYA-4618 / FGSC 9003) TaxID=240176 RepID=A8NXP0_COPC7|nr:hypothetical protein CC1G_00360 [Coprinopsis cinerea okayama7\|eukprot:XP_001837224.2 hypothetical protein CC1G_00360 [Coprinopsis cinerea okayama7\